ncbi:MAG: phosphoglycerate kinase [candidate division CPR1 bacterium GW2011_GWC1_49_13]|uniref:Phosphoglycerate kinase n=1 Tax=candidate division CPR1 bacterium GW2011_GWC1_49_13 TaxID=1618342 RepID=A0A0G1XTY1_9BACT|nr:MAG: phosphoglycerate kinase [candidate division CPR1 bacterium GW2011_GWC1_49_13]
MKLRSLTDLKNLAGKRILLQGDLDVPVSEGKIEEDYRLKALLPTLNFLLERKGRVLIIGKLGRPKGKKDPALSLQPVADWFSEKLGEKVEFISDLSGNPSSRIALLENLRFWEGEERNDSEFAKQLASLGEIYVNDAFANSHRNHASIAGVPRLIPAYAGLQLEKEVQELGSVLVNPARPLVFVLGGAKTETKMPLVPSFAKIADQVLLGGLLMFDRELEGTPKVTFPVDATDAYDIGPETIRLFTKLIKEAQTVVWNGPVGKWEDNRYELGTRAIAEELALLKEVKTVVGGGDTIAALSSFGLLSEMDYVSLGGGAMLQFLAGKELPGLAALKE